jgi:HK97 family phage portal protein
LILSLPNILKKAFGASADQKALSLNDPALSEVFGVRQTYSGAAVTSRTALAVPAVLQAVRLISETIGSLPCKLYRETEAGKEAAKDHSAYRITHIRANEWTGAGDLRTRLTADALLHGGGFARIVRYPDDGRPFELHRIKPEKVMLLEDDVTGAPVYRISETNGTRDYLFSEILHVPSFLGTSPLSHGREAIGIASVLERHAAQLFKGGARPPAVIHREKAIPSDAAVGEASVKNLRARFQASSANGFDVPLILDDGWQYQQMAFSSTDSQFLGNRIEQINEIARIFGVPPHLLYQLEDGTYSNNEQMQAGFLQLCVRPWLDRWQDAYATVLLTEEERDSHYFEFVIDDLQRADSAARAEIFSKLISARVMTPNEVRAAMNMPPLPGGDELANPYTSTSTPAGTMPPKEAA